ncbi:alpha/beta hydrolase [Candidatus Gottesmanbacteria bacterium]|nr:alpha/beta hydrolase [Candidatus Gottesmanbacteria bacterium]
MKRDIIILHGWGLDGSRFTPLKTELEKRGARVWAPDFPGFGSAKNPQAPYHLFEYAMFLRDFMKKYKIQNPGFIGHSFGGRVALKYDFLFPKSVRWIVLTGTPGFRSSSSLKVSLGIAIVKLGKYFVSLPLMKNFKNSITQSYYSFIGVQGYGRAQGTMKDTFKYIVSEPLESYMKSLSVPCLLLWGELDTLVPTQIAVRMHNAIPNSTVSIIRGFGHSVPYTSPYDFVRLMKQHNFI